MNHTDCPKQ